MNQREADPSDGARAQATALPRAHVDIQIGRPARSYAPQAMAPDQRFGASSATVVGSSATWTEPAFSSR